MSLAYDSYIRNHVYNIRRGMNILIENISLDKLNDILPNLNTDELNCLAEIHDQSKHTSSEYTAYDNYFYHAGYSTDEGKRQFDYAWLHHIHNNPHHWQYWVLIEDDANLSEKTRALDMPDNYILEMISDWWTFSWSKYATSNQISDLEEIFDWYELHKDLMILSVSTKDKVEKLLIELRSIIVNLKIEDHNS